VIHDTNGVLRRCQRHHKECRHDNDPDDSLIFRSKPHCTQQHQKQYENEAAKVTVIHHERQVERHTHSRQGDKYP
jgi:hypothetical protein